MKLKGSGNGSVLQSWKAGHGHGIMKQKVIKGLQNATSSTYQDSTPLNPSTCWAFDSL